MQTNKKLTKNPLSIYAEGWRMAKRGYNHKKKSYRNKQQFKILFHTLLNTSFSYKWFTKLHSQEFYDIFSQRPQLYIKPFRPYLSTNFSKEQKVKVITDSYRFLKTTGNTFHDKFLKGNNGATVADLVFNDKPFGVLKIGYDERYRKEGEFVLYIDDHTAKLYLSISFSFEEKSNGNWACLIGCIQGRNDVKTLRSLQKSMNSMRPNNFMIFAIQELCKNWGVHEIYGVGNAIQSNGEKHFININSIHKINFNYDGFWKEVGGAPSNDGWFQLPSQMVYKKYEEIKSKKRSMYKKRYAMLDQIASNIAEKLNSFKQ